MKCVLSVILLVLFRSDLRGADDFFASALKTTNLVHYATNHLSAMREERIAGRESDTNLFVVRILWMYFEQRPVAVRYEARQDRGLKRTIGLRWNTTKQKHEIKENIEEPVTKAEIDRLKEALKKSSFWDLSPEAHWEGKDGYFAIVECVSAGKYHVIARWSPPEGGLQKLADFLEAEIIKIGI